MTTLMEASDFGNVRFQEIEEQAIAHAMAGRWEKALASNAQVISIAPDNAEAYNRCAKALIELGRYEEAKTSAEAALKIRPGHSIAKRNLERINQLLANGKVRKMNGGGQVTRPSAFIADRARSTVTVLRSPAPAQTLAMVSPGDPLTLAVDGGRLKVVTAEGQSLGNLEVRLAQHLARLIQGGNKYEAAAAKVSGGTVAVVVRELSRSSKQAHLVSFPPALQKYSAVRAAADLDDDDSSLDDDSGAAVDMDIDEEDIPQPGEASTERLKAFLSGDSSDDSSISDDALAV